MSKKELTGNCSAYVRMLEEQKQRQANRRVIAVGVATGVLFGLMWLFSGSHTQEPEIIVLDPYEAAPAAEDGKPSMENPLLMYATGARSKLDAEIERQSR